MSTAEPRKRLHEPAGQTPRDKFRSGTGRSGVLREVTCDLVAGREFGEWRLGRPADLLRLPASGVEAAGGRRVERAWHISGEPDALPSAPGRWSGGGHGRQEGHSVRMTRCRVKLLAAR